MTQEEAVAVALWNIADFQVSLSELGFARADLLEAGLLTNPVLSLLFPVGPKQFEMALKWPVEALWQRPRRVAAARLAADAAAERLVQAGLDLVLAVKVAHADVALPSIGPACRRIDGAPARISELTHRAWRQATSASSTRRAATVEAIRARRMQSARANDVVIARERLRALLDSHSADRRSTIAAQPRRRLTAAG